MSAPSAALSILPQCVASTCTGSSWGHAQASPAQPPTWIARMEQLRATLASVAQLLGDGMLTPSEAAEMKAAAMQDFAKTRQSMQAMQQLDVQKKQLEVEGLSIALEGQREAQRAAAAAIREGLLGLCVGTLSTRTRPRASLEISQIRSVRRATVCGNLGARATRLLTVLCSARLALRGRPLGRVTMSFVTRPWRAQARAACLQLADSPAERAHGGISAKGRVRHAVRALRERHCRDICDLWPQ